MRFGLRRWAELKTTDFAQVDPERDLVLLPVAAVEQHGPHLPLGTDLFILEALLARLDALAQSARIVVLPLQAIGDSLEHGEFRGTLSCRPELLIESWTALGRAAADAGFRKLAIVNSHGGQPQVVDIVAKRLRAAHRLLVGRVNTFLLGLPPDLFSADELAYGFHGGEVETSMMLAIAPQLVDLSAAEAFPTQAERLARENEVLRAEGPAAFAWQAQDLNPLGVMGNAAAADPERGRVALDHIAMRLAQALVELSQLPLSLLRDGPR
jgi:creatinine amidohydrolase